jgi:thermitase
MQSRLFATIVSALFVLSLAGCSAKVEEKNPAIDAIPGSVIVSGSGEAIDEVLRDQGIQFSKALADAELEVFELTVSPDAVSNTIESLNQDSRIQFAEPNAYLRLKSVNATATTDPLALAQWAIDNLGQDSPSGSQGQAGADISAAEAWAVEKGDRRIVVGVIDTGVDYDHPDLKPNMWVNTAEKNGVPGKDDDGNGYTDDVYGWNFIHADSMDSYFGQLGSPDPYDDNEHGTHCAGIIGAVPSNAEGIAGVNWEVSIMALKFLNQYGSGSTLDAFRAIMYGVRNRVDILSNSWGGGGYSRALHQAVQKAHEAGILFVAAAGNSRADNDVTDSFPANYDVESLVSVAASTNRDELAGFTSYGVKKVHLAAPGQDIMSTVPRSSGGRARYASFSGTSMATPYVAGAAALLLAHDSSLRGQPTEVKRRLMATVDIQESMIGKIASRGRLNLKRLLDDDRNPSVDTDVKEEERVVMTPRFNPERFDTTWSVVRPGASRIRLNFEYAMIDQGFDFMAVYDRNGALVWEVTQDNPFPFSTPWFEGNEVTVRFANALVEVRRSTTKIFDNPDRGYREGASNCRRRDDGRWECQLQDRSTPIPNFASEGFKLTSISYQE